MDKLRICRICLVENVRMCAVVDKNMHELYEKLTDIPFVTEDNRPMLSCFICYAKLKQCCQLQRKCLAAEELLAQMINEPNPSINRSPLQFFNGLMKTPMQNISIVDVSQIDSVTIKEKSLVVCDRQDGVMEPKQENPQDGVELDHENYGYSDEEDITLHYSESDEDSVPLIKLQIEEDEGQEVSRKRRRASDTRSLELDHKDYGYSDEEDFTLHYSESDGDNVSLIELQIEEDEGQEVSRKSRRASDTRRPTAAKKSKLYMLSTKLEDANVEEQNESARANMKVMQTTHRRPNLSTFKEAHKCDILCQLSFVNKTLLTKHLHRHTGEKPFKCDICQRCFRRKNALTKHIHTHTGEKPYKCDICQRRFSRKDALITHIPAHW